MTKSVRGSQGDTTLDFETHCRRVWSSRFFRRLGALYWQRWPRGPWKAAPGEVVLDRPGHFEVPRRSGPFLSAAIEQFGKFLEIGFGIRVSARRYTHVIRFRLCQGPSHPEGFTIEVSPERTIVSSRTENGLAQGLFHLERKMELRGAPILSLGTETLTPRFDLRLHCDVWGGNTVTPRWLDVPRRRETFLLLARHGINATQIRAQLGDFFHDPSYPEVSCPTWKKNLGRLRQLVEQAGACGLSIFLHADNFRLAPDHPLFRRRPALRGTPIFHGTICPICTGSREGTDLIARGWERVFGEVPRLGGLIAIVGGECFTHCAMRPVLTADGRNPCPRCGSQHPADVAADLVGAVARRVRRVAPQARLLAWPYSAESPSVWNADQAEMERFIRRVPKDVVYVLEIDKEGVQPVRRAPGVFRNIWDYSSSFVGPSARFTHQSAVAKQAGLRLCVKTETLQGWEAGLLPYLPVMDHWQRRWTLLRRTPARDIHLGWPLAGFNDSPPAELAAWQLWNRTPSAQDVLDRMIQRDFGPRAAATARKAYRLFGEALEMLPVHCAGYYSGIQFLGAAQPLLLRKDEPLEDAFQGFHFYEGEGFSTIQSAQVKRTELPSRQNAAVPVAFPDRTNLTTIAIQCLRRAEKAWRRALALYESVAPVIPPHRRAQYAAERRIFRHLAHWLRTWLHMEEFYQHRSRVDEMDIHCYARQALRSRRVRVFRRMRVIAEDELANSRAAWINCRGDDRLDLSLRLDTPTVPMENLYGAKLRHTRRLIATLRSLTRQQRPTL